LSGRGLCDELITRPEESYRLCCVVVCDLETSRMGAPYIYDISCLRVKLLLKCDDIRAETTFPLSAKQTSPFKSAGASVQSTTGSRGLRISGRNSSNAGYTMFRGSVNGTGYPLPFSKFPFTSPPVGHRVPSRFNWTVPYYMTSVHTKSTRALK